MLEIKPIEVDFKEWYRQTDGDTCPYCNSTELDGVVIEKRYGYHKEEVSCMDCNKEWTVEIKFMGVIGVNGQYFDSYNESV
jgi:transcription elongation factor Elf1